jgi:hypothetical protein
LELTVPASSMALNEMVGLVATKVAEEFMLMTYRHVTYYTVTDVFRSSAWKVSEFRRL